MYHIIITFFLKILKSFGFNFQPIYRFGQFAYIHTYETQKYRALSHKHWYMYLADNNICNNDKG